jgi:hypothetical protein
MPLIPRAPHQSAEDLRTVYRALGMSEQTLERAIQPPDKHFLVAAH